MDIQSVPVGSSLRLYYKAKNLKTSQSVIFNVWDSEGTPLYANVAADGEIGSKGVYFLDITTPSADAYILVKGSLSDGSDIGVSIYSVGLPDQKVFYVHGSYATGQTIPYRIFDFDASDQDTGDLTEVGGGFYYTDVSEISSELDLFFKVGELVYEFDLTQLIIQVSGGVLVSGLAAPLVVARPIASGGVELGGTAPPSYYEIGSGGAELGGVAIEELVGGVSGGIKVSGTADELVQLLAQGGVGLNGSAIIAIGEVAEGGVATDGTAFYGLVLDETTEGGTVVSGQTQPAIGWLPSDGVLVNGSAVEQVTYTIQTLGGAIANGIALKGIGSEISGGVANGGSSIEIAIYNIVPEDGVIISGVADNSLIKNVVPVSGGAISGGSADQTCIYAVVAEDGVIISGEANVSSSDIVEVEGGIVVNGQAESSLIISEISSGGSVVHGTASVECIAILTTSGGIITSGSATENAIYNSVAVGGGELNGSSYNVFTETTVGGIVVSGQAFTWHGWIPQGGVTVGGDTEEFITFWNYLRDRDYLYGIGDIVYLREPKKNRPSRYHQHTVEGIRFYGDYNLYDIGLGILFDESMFVSPLNKDVIQTEEATRTEEYAEGKIDRLDNTPIISDPAGGDLEFVEDLSHEVGPDPSSALSAINRLKNVSPLPDPTGGSIEFSSTNCCPSIPGNISVKLNRLYNTTPLADPAGGSMSFDMTEPRTSSDPSSYFQRRLTTLESTPVLPDPVGGIVVFTEQNEIEQIDVDSIKRKLETLGDIALLPDPTGSYIIRSVTEPA